MDQARNDRRSVLLAGLNFAGLVFFAGCGGEEQQESLKLEEDPAAKAQDSMNYYKNTQLKGARK